MRLEETSRDWKEQFLRVEQERQMLLSRIDELVAEKMIVCIPLSISFRVSREPTVLRFHSIQIKHPFQHHSIRLILNIMN